MKPRLKEKIDFKYLKISLYAVVSVVVTFVVCMLLYRFRGVFIDALRIIIAVLKPVAFGALICYLLTPITNHLIRLLSRKDREPQAWVRPVAVVLTILFIFAVVAGLVLLLSLFIYQGIRSISMEDIRDVIATIKDDIAAFTAGIQGLELPSGKLDNLLTDLIGNAGEIVSGIVAGLPKAASTLLFTIIFCIYFMLDGKRIGDSLKHVFAVLCKENTVKKTQLLLKDADTVFSGYLRGRILDSLLLAVVLAIAFRIANVPYAYIAGLLVGIVNLIPYLGCIVAYAIVILVYLVEGDFSGIWICLVILTVIQTIDAYVVCPKIINRSVMIHPLLVIVAMIAGGAVGGVLGMLLAIPVMAFLKLQFDRFIERREKMKTEAAAPAPAPEEKVQE